MARPRNVRAKVSVKSFMFAEVWCGEVVLQRFFLMIEGLKVFCFLYIVLMERLSR
jgi:hypothetical protein